MRRHLRCASWALLGLVLGLAANAYGQEPSTTAGLEVLLPPWAAAIVRELGLPGALLVLGWWARGSAIRGIPVEVRLHSDTIEQLGKPPTTPKVDP